MQLEQLLAQRPDLWLGRGLPAAAPSGVPTGFAALDAALPWRGWPRGSLSEILTTQQGAGLALALPMLIALSRQPRWLLLVNPPLIPYAPALAAHGLDLARLVVVRPSVQAGVQAGAEHTWAWAMEQGLRSGACAAVLAWPDARSDQGAERPNRSGKRSVGSLLRRLQLAADAGDALAILLRTPPAAVQPSPAALRLAVQCAGAGLTVTLLKQRGGRPGSQIQLGG
jgi:hypothetical protein